MRIIQGKYKGRVIDGFTLEGTRPTMERVKESLFAILQDQIKDAICLDLFAGSGNLGIEAISMGAKEVVFVDQNKKAVKTIQKNLSILGEEAQVLCMDFEKACQKFFREQKKFSIVFLDPPYETSFIEKGLVHLSKDKLLNKNGLVVCESNHKEKIKYNSSSYEVYKEKTYGDKYILILKKTE